MTQEKSDSSSSLSFSSLKCVLFLYFGGLSCILAFLPLHMRDIGLTGNEGRIVSIVAPCVSIIGPMFIGPLVDRWGAGATISVFHYSLFQYSRHMRGLLAIFLSVGALAYSSLLFVPKVSRLQQRNPAVTFLCTADSSFILQEKCQDSACYNWAEDNFGSLYLSHCVYSCDNVDRLDLNDSIVNTSPHYSEDTEVDNYEDEGSGKHVTTDENSGLYLSKDDDALKSPPHLCVRMASGRTVCHVYTPYSEQLTINVTLRPSPSTVLIDEWCRYPIAGKVSCHMPPTYEKCFVTCDLNNPYTEPSSLLVHAKCQKTIGDDQVTFWSYLSLRSLADIFPVTVVVLLSSCIITATRDAPGHLGPLLAIAAFGIAVFPPLSLFTFIKLSELFGDGNSIFNVPLYAVPIVTYAVFSIIAALIIIFDKSMPLSPVDYHLHSNCGYITVKGAGIETIIVLIILVLLGTLWSTLDSYLPWHLLLELKGSEMLVALTLTAGALPSIPFLCYSERIINLCGHSNLFMIAFSFYIIRFTGLVFFVNPWWVLLCEALEVFTLSIMWVVAMFYMKQLMARHLTTSGQALAVIAHFCVGRSIGAVVGGVLSQNDSLVPVYKISSVVAAVIASVYFIIYHCFLRSKCLSHPKSLGYRNPQSAVQGTNANGTYTPLKVYARQDRSNNNQLRY